MDGCFSLIIVIVLVGIGIGIVVTSSQRKALEAARLAYQSSLQQLTTDPSNTPLRQHTLQLGRKYAELARKAAGSSKSVTLFDEVALLNDINAACGAAAVSSSAQPAPTGASSIPSSIEDRLARLNSLRAQGLITEEDFNIKKASLLREI
jgi:hypothetical protein